MIDVARKNVYGMCPLCLRSAKLCKSHYLGRVLHNLSRDGKDHPVIMTPKLVKATPSQMWAHLLCSDCEQRFNERGEKPVIALFNGPKDFPLLNRMNVAMPIKEEPTVVTYSGIAMGIETEPLAYYALSVIWKGSVHEWITLKGQKSSVNLRKYQEPIRQHLLDQAGFPEGVHVVVTACTDFGSQGMTFAPSGMAGTMFPMYSLLVRGIWFHVFTADGSPRGVDGLCCVRSVRKKLFKADCTKPFLESGGHILSTAIVHENLREPTAKKTRT
jgi:hypothetical protein